MNGNKLNLTHNSKQVNSYLKSKNPDYLVIINCKKLLSYQDSFIMKEVKKVKEIRNSNHKLIHQIKTELAALEMHILLEKEKVKHNNRS